ncbi:hypothetical protein K1719_040434 [Acacia pycnantha]|nr:hypothetical protein K1719_040434 [Acacia pycnantha]
MKRRRIISFLWKDLIRLELTNFTPRSPPDFVVDFKSHVQLHLHVMQVESPTLEILISSCPSLEGLTISYCTGFDYLINIVSPNIKVLTNHTRFLGFELNLFGGIG